MPRALLPLTLLLAACGVEPRTGTWLFTNDEVKTNTCKVDIAAGDFALINNGDGTFTVDPEDGTDPFKCVLDGDAFDCPQRLQGTISEPGVDAVISFNVRAAGTFDSETYALGTQTGVGTCTGSACPVASTVLGIPFPCETTATFSASFKAPL